MVHGAMEKNLRLDELEAQLVLLWVQIWGLPFEYQFPALAISMGNMIGTVLQFDWEMRLPRNIRFLGVKVDVNHRLPLLVGCILRMDDRQTNWVQFWYEKIFKILQKVWFQKRRHRVYD